MYSRGEINNGTKIPYGFGFRIDPDKQNTIYHNGNWNGFRTGLKQYPDDDLAIIILEHTGYKEINYLSKKIKNIVLNNFKDYSSIIFFQILFHVSIHPFFNLYLLLILEIGWNSTTNPELQFTAQIFNKILIRIHRRPC